MKVLLWHGYLLGGTGSNVYTRALARAWSQAGHEVVVFAQEPHPERFDLGGATVVRPDLAGGPLPVFVLDRYEDLDARYLQDLTQVERDAYIERNAAAVREHLPADVLFVNHVLPGAAVGAAVGTPFGVKAHGSELEFSIRGNAGLAAWARECLAEADAVYAGTEHIRQVLEEVVGPGDYLDRVHVVPPGVDTELLRPEPRDEALARLLEESSRDAPNPDNRLERLPDDGNADRLAAFLSGEAPTVVYVGKLSEEKGVHLLLEALHDLPEVRAVVVGFGPARAELEEAAPAGRVLFTGPLEHRHLAHLWPLADVSVTPSVFPEAFGMVAAEAASCGSPPLVARHSGLAEIASAVESEYPPERRDLASFAPGDAADLRGTLERLLALDPDERAALGLAARRAVESRYGWQHIAAVILSL
jgi:glycosyltransferase involved in cell wall biosynthesis